jgi:hypothetical protein
MYRNLIGKGPIQDGGLRIRRIASR